MPPVINELKKELTGKRVWLRVDWNAPLVDGKAVEPLRLDQSVATIKFLQKAGAKITIGSHLSNSKDSLQPMIDYVGKKVDLSGINILPNLRASKGEVKNDPKLAAEWAKDHDLYVNDAFSASHREHTSIVGLPKLLPGYLGLSFAGELEALAEVGQPIKPFLAIIAGAKFESKLPVIEKFLPQAGKIFVGGALANLFLKREGYEIGQSYVDPKAPSITTLLRNGKIEIPRDVVIAREGEKLTVIPDEVRGQDKIMDAGSATLERLAQLVKDANFILWVGPLGLYEEGYDEGTNELAKLIASSNKRSILGGGDTVTAISRLKLFDQFTFVSAGGGAMLEYLATGTLPGLEALKNSNFDKKS
jgi:phosphoglycerate kinase